MYARRAIRNDDRMFEVVTILIAWNYIQARDFQDPIDSRLTICILIAKVGVARRQPRRRPSSSAITVHW